MAISSVYGKLELRAYQGILILVAVGFSYVAGLIIYRLYLHPLAKYPGPILGRLTNLYGGYQSWKGTFHEDVSNCHKKYGNIVRYAPNRILFNTTGGLQDIYGHRSNVIKSTIYNQMVHRAPNILTQRDKAQHAVRRRVMSYGFSENALRGFEPLIRAPIDKFCEKLLLSAGNANAWSEPFNVSKWCDYLTFDIMTAVIFSRSYNALDLVDKRNIIQAIEDSNVRVSVLIQADSLRFWRLDKKLFPKAIAARNVFIKFVSEILKDRLFSKQPNEKDIFSLLKNAKDPETGATFTEKEFGGEIATLIVAGSDTTSTTMASTLFYLTRNPVAYKNATSEVRKAFSDLGEVHTGSQLNSCVYLRACIDEALRMSPPAGGVLWREVQSGGASIDGHFMPEGVDVGTGIYSIHHNPEYYPNPLSYRPERWLKVNPRDAGIQPYCPFSIGPRSCIGKSLALMEVMLTIAVILLQFDVQDAEEGHNSFTDIHEVSAEFRLRDHITGAKDGPSLRFRAANHTPN
ncbi:fatty acid synthase alpha subunit reductase [Phlyctema vagabunda]|uniref:Fatty acid synthase alpha subunit reductase n=1 Tax=Phlyctema vagabunda TaxID=108571 RepID=A0ABR4PUN0_9HELO